MAVIRSQCKNEEEYRQALRDDFAAAALTGIVSREQISSYVQALWAYEVADAMLAEREKSNVEK